MERATRGPRTASRVLIADDHPLVRDALRHVVIGACGLETECVEASDFGELVRLTDRDGEFDLIIVDLLMPGGDWPAALRSLRRRAPSTPILVISARDDTATVSTALSCGVAGYISKSASKSAMQSAVARVLDGEVYVSDNRSRRKESREPISSSVPAREGLEERQGLTARQLEVLELMARGSSNREIAAQLHIEEITVKAHVSAIFQKLNVRNRVQAVMAAQQLMETMPALSHPATARSPGSLR